MNNNVYNLILITIIITFSFFHKKEIVFCFHLFSEKRFLVDSLSVLKIKKWTNAQLYRTFSVTESNLHSEIFPSYLSTIFFFKSKIRIKSQIE